MGARHAHHFLLESADDREDPDWIKGVCRDCGKQDRWPPSLDTPELRQSFGTLGAAPNPVANFERDRYRRVQGLG